MTDEMKKAGLIKIGCLAHRKGVEFDPFEAKIDFETKHIKDIIQSSTNTQVDKDSGIQYIPLDA
jgi:hypothetical protein